MKTQNFWFLRFIYARPKLSQLAGLRQQTVLALPGLEPRRGAQVRQWQRKAVAKI